MKKVGYLLLLAPSFFLASCQTTPKIDTIDENEAQKFIEENYTHPVSWFKAPSNESTITWNVTAGDTKPRENISKYMSSNGDVTSEKKGKNVKITDTTRLNNYLEQLNATADYYAIGEDAIIGMNWNDIYPKLYALKSNDVDPNELVYKRGSNNGLIIIVKSTYLKLTNTRTHTYDYDGRETKFEVSYADSDMAYTMTINFKYN